jgi:hypothetical protein
MYVNKCIKCGQEFETKNPKRVICPECLYPDKEMMPTDSESAAPQPQQDEVPRYYSAGGENQERPQRPRQDGYNRDNRQGGYQNRSQGAGYNRDNRGGGYGNRPQQGGYNRDNRQGSGGGGYQNRNQGGGYNRDNRTGGYGNRPQQQGGGYNRDNRGGGYGNRPQQGGYQNRSQGAGYNRDNRGGGYGNRPQRPMQGRRPSAPKQLLVSREQLEQIELLYKGMLPLPNPDAHEVIGEKIGLEPRKVFFGINLIRQKLMLPKLPFPKRKLAISPDQLFAIKNLYEPLLPLPPIGCHKIIAAQLKMDEWRVHVGIGLVRSQMGLQRWNQDRTDLPAEFKQKPAAAEEEKVTEEKPKRGRKKKTDE